MLRGFGIGNTAETSAQLDIAFKVRGALPLGGGVVEFRCPVRKLLQIHYCRDRERVHEGDNTI
jgi:RNA 3'-terminal phosphate cyclase